MAASFRLFVALVLLFVSAYAKDGFVVLRGSAEHQINSISDTHVVDLLSHLNGLAPVHKDLNRNTFPRTNLFDRPAVNLLVALDAVTIEMLNAAKTNFLNLEHEARIARLDKASYPQDSLATLMNVMTGQEPSNHGIYGHSWANSRVSSVDAFSQFGRAKSPKIVDRLAVSSEGSARILAVSGSDKMALALGTHSELVKAHPDWNCEASAFDKKKGLVDLYSGEALKSVTEIRDFAAERDLSLTTLEGFVLGSELMQISTITERLSAMATSGTEFPDFVGVGITSIKQLSAKFGVSSLQVSEALRLLDEALVDLQQKLDEMYEGQVITQIIGLSSGTDEHTFYTQNKQLLFARNLAGNNTNNSTINGNSTATNSTSGYTPNEVTAFQTQLWVAVVLIIAFIASTLTLVKMDMLENSLIYRTTDGPRPIQDVQ